jgi:hypothetical protein
MVVLKMISEVMPVVTPGTGMTISSAIPSQISPALA